MPSLDSSIPGESASDTESSSSDSDGRGRSHPDSPDVVFLGNAENDGSEEDIISLSGFSKSDTEEVRVAAVCEKACIRVMCCMPPGLMTRSIRATMR